MNGRNGRRKQPTGRVEGGFVAMPWEVLDSPAYRLLGHPARALLMEVARQYVRDNNGRLLTSRAYLMKRGWNSADVITRAVRELEAAGFIHQMVKGHRPNKASWWAITWYTLDPHPGYDPGAAATFKRGTYREMQPLKNASHRPPAGAERAAIAPAGGVGRARPVPSGGAMDPCFDTPPRPSGGHHLEKHLPLAVGLAVGRDCVSALAAGHPQRECKLIIEAMT